MGNVNPTALGPEPHDLAQLRVEQERARKYPRPGQLSNSRATPVSPSPPAQNNVCFITNLQSNQFFKQTFQKANSRPSLALKESSLTETCQALEFAVCFQELYALQHLNPPLPVVSNLIGGRQAKTAKQPLRRSNRLELLDSQVSKRHTSMDLWGAFEQPLLKKEFKAQVELLKNARPKAPAENREIGLLRLRSKPNLVSSLKKLQKQGSKVSLASFSRSKAPNNPAPKTLILDKRPNDPASLPRNTLDHRSKKEPENTPRFERKGLQTLIKDLVEPSKGKNTSLSRPGLISDLSIKPKVSASQYRAKPSANVNPTAKAEKGGQPLPLGSSQRRKSLAAPKSQNPFLASYRDKSTERLSRSDSQGKSHRSGNNRRPEVLIDARPQMLEGLVFSFQPSDPKPLSDSGRRFKESENLEDTIARISSQNKLKRESFFKENSNLSLDTDPSGPSFVKRQRHYIDLEGLAQGRVAPAPKRPTAHHLLTETSYTAAQFQMRPSLANPAERGAQACTPNRSRSAKTIELGLDAGELSRLSHSGTKSNKKELLRQISTNNSPLKPAQRVSHRSSTLKHVGPDNSAFINLSKHSFFKTKLGPDPNKENQTNKSLAGLRSALLGKATVDQRQRLSWLLKDLDHNANHLSHSSLKKTLRADRPAPEGDKFNDAYLASTNHSSKDTVQQNYPVVLNIKAFPSNVKFNMGGCFLKK